MIPPATKRCYVAIDDPDAMDQDRSAMTTRDGIIKVRPVLFCAPVFWTSEFWSESTHDWCWVRAETPLGQKPWADVDVSLDVTLGQVFAEACDAWRIAAGPDLLKRGGTREQQFVRFAFVQPDRDADGVDARRGYRWPRTLPIARENGTIEQVPALEITYRELLASSLLGLLEGDVTRPYVHPVIPQGPAGDFVEPLRLTLEAIRAAYTGVDHRFGVAAHTIIRLVDASLPTAERNSNEVVDEGVRIAAVFAFGKWLRKRLRHRHGRDKDE